MPRQALVTGLGFITPIGNTRAAVTQSLRAGLHGIETVEFLNNPNLAVKVVGTIKDFVAGSPNWRDWSYPSNYAIPPRPCVDFPPTACLPSVPLNRL